MPLPRARAHKTRPQALASPACDPGNGLSRHDARTRYSPSAVTTHLSRKCVYGRNMPHTPTSGKTRQHDRADCPGGCAIQGCPILYLLTPANPSAENGMDGVCRQARYRAGAMATITPACLEERIARRKSHVVT